MRKLVGWTALIALLAAANLLAWYRDLFVWSVGLPLILGLGAGVAWLVMLGVSQLSTFRMQGRAAGGLNAVVASTVFFGICVLLYAFTLSTKISLDLTREGRVTLEKQTVQVLQTLNKKVDVTCFFLQSDDELITIAREKTLRFLEQCKNNSTLLNVVEEDPQVAVEKWEAEGITRASPQGTVIIACEGRKRVITLAGSSPRLEERDFTNALIAVLRETEPKVCFLTGHEERRLEEVGAQGSTILNDLLQRESYKTESIAIKVTDPVIPADCDVLVINNPRADFQPSEISALDEFANRGGRIFLLLDPWIRVNAAPGLSEQLRPWVAQRFGIDIGGDIVVAEREQQQVLEVELNADSQPFSDQDQKQEFNGCFSSVHPVTRSFDQSMVLQICRTATPAKQPPAKTSVTALLRSGPEYWAESDVAGLRDNKRATRDENEPRGPLYLAAAATQETDRPIEGANRNKEARMLVVGDSSISANDSIRLPGNVNFILNSIAWLTESEQLIAIRPRGKDDPPLLLSDGQRRAVFWFSTLLTGQAALCAGVAMAAIRRKNQ